MKRVLLTICYDGTVYHGWQVQKNAVTVQSVLGDAIKSILKKKTDITGCSRTDAGVHAKMFCLHLDCDDNIPESAFLSGLNSVLPDDISVTDCKFVESDFHARYSCKGKTYVYNFYTGKPNPFLSRYALRLEKEPNVDLINKFCETVVGKHDFFGFSSSGRTVSDTVRTVTDCHFIKSDGKYMLKITADGFLYNMVRIIAGTAIDVSNGILPYDTAIKVFNTKDRNFAGKTLSPKGLFLEKVYY